MDRKKGERTFERGRLATPGHRERSLTRKARPGCGSTFQAMRCAEMTQIPGGGGVVGGGGEDPQRLGKGRANRQAGQENGKVRDGSSVQGKSERAWPKRRKKVR